MKRGRNQRRRQGVNINRAYDSNGPEVRIRGTANQIYDKYLALARDAASSGDRVKAENYLQHAEHYFRVIRAMQATQQPPMQHPDSGDNDGDQPSLGGGHERERPRDMMGPSTADDQDNEPEEAPVAAASGRPANGHAEPAEQGEAGRRPRRRRPRRGPRPDGEEPASESEEPAEVAAG